MGMGLTMEWRYFIIPERVLHISTSKRQEEADRHKDLKSGDYVEGGQVETELLGDFARFQRTTGERYQL
jgi:hypothetical protein